MITTLEGLPVDFYIHAGSFVDITAFQSINLDLPEGSKVYADAGYTDYEQEDLYQSLENIDLRVCRKLNSTRNEETYMAFLKNYYRKRIEVTFSQVTNFFPKKIHAVTKERFVLKLELYILAFTLCQLSC